MNYWALLSHSGSGSEPLGVGIWAALGRDLGRSGAATPLSLLRRYAAVLAPLCRYPLARGLG